MQGVLEVATSAWKQWGLQALVMLSFTLQVTLLVLAEFRRRIDSGMLRFFVWSAYMLADTTAIYVLGHLSVTTSSPEHELMAFWAPFLLLHLGGQDSITAYAIEDNNLWLRHLQTFAVQVAAAAYIFYESSVIISSRSLLCPATAIMFVIGVLKYGERVWALKCAGSSPSGSNYRSFDMSTASAVGALPTPQDRSTEAFLLIAHLLLAAPMDLLKGPSTFVDVQCGTWVITGEDLYKVSEMQISLMHDVFYTKAEVIHSWCGLCIRVVSTLGTVAALLLFHLMGDGKDGYSRVDVVISYVLLVGAVILEITSALRAMFSSWTFVILDWRTEGTNIWHFLACTVASLRRLAHAADWWRYWSGSMGQHNLLRLCVRSWASKRIARWMGLEDLWNTIAYSWSLPVLACIKELVVDQVLKSEGIPESSPYHIHNSRGRAVIESKEVYKELVWRVDIDLDESILIWHIASDIYLCWYKDQPKEDAELMAHAEVIKTVEVLSNYMLFLLAARPYMLPPPASRNAYVHVCHFLTYLECSTPEDLANSLWHSGNELNTRPNAEGNETASTGNTGDSSRYKKKLDRACQLGAKLIDYKSRGLGTVDMLELLAQVWVEILCYVGYRCSGYSHAKQLSDGGEFITVAALVMKHIRRQTSEF